jgi:hypothetical protein
MQRRAIFPSPHTVQISPDHLRLALDQPPDRCRHGKVRAQQRYTRPHTMRRS